MRRRLLVAAAVIAAVVVVVTVGVLGYDEVSGERTVGETSCIADNRNLLAAQSVPGAAYVPCFASELAGWQLEGGSVGSDGTTYSLATPEIPGATWDLELRPDCAPSASAVEVVPSVAITSGRSDIGVAHPVPAGATLWEESDDVPDAEAFRRVQWYRFAGGCVQSVVEIPARFDRRIILADLDRMLVFVDRSALDEEVRVDTGGHLGLDPPPTT